MKGREEVGNAITFINGDRNNLAEKSCCAIALIENNKKKKKKKNHVEKQFCGRRE